MSERKKTFSSPSFQQTVTNLQKFRTFGNTTDNPAAWACRNVKTDIPVSRNGIPL